MMSRGMESCWLTAACMREPRPSWTATQWRFGTAVSFMKWKRLPAPACLPAVSTCSMKQEQATQHRGRGRYTPPVGWCCGVPPGDYGMSKSSLCTAAAAVAAADDDCYWEQLQLPEASYESEGEEWESVDSGGVREHSGRGVVAQKLKKGEDPVTVLQEIGGISAAVLWDVLAFLMEHSRFTQAFQVVEWYRKQDDYDPGEVQYSKFINIAAKAKRAAKAQELFDEMVGKGILPTFHSYTCLLHAYADSDLFHEAEKVLSDMVEKGCKPSTVTYSCLIHAYGRNNMLDEMAKLFNDMKTVSCSPDPFTYATLIRAFARGGLIKRMTKTYKEMGARGWGRNAPCVNHMIQAYAVAGLIKEMEAGYQYLRNERLAVAEDSIRAMALAYIRKCYFFQLGVFVKNAGLKRNNVKNLLWNLLLLSFGANFSMKNLEREFANMRLAGFSADITTFNIRARAFCNMHMYWDLHITVQHMLAEGIRPDLITFEAIIDAYLDGRLEAKLAEALQETRSLHFHPEIKTESFVVEAFGKGNFHAFYEELSGYLSEEKAKQVTYADVVSLYLEYVKRKSKQDNSQQRRPPANIFKKQGHFNL